MTKPTHHTAIFPAWISKWLGEKWEFKMINKAQTIGTNLNSEWEEREKVTNIIGNKGPSLAILIMYDVNHIALHSHYNKLFSGFRDHGSAIFCKYARYHFGNKVGCSNWVH